MPSGWSSFGLAPSTPTSLITSGRRFLGGDPGCGPTPGKATVSLALVRARPPDDDADGGPGRRRCRDHRSSGARDDISFQFWRRAAKEGDKTTLICASASQATPHPTPTSSTFKRSDFRTTPSDTNPSSAPPPRRPGRPIRRSSCSLASAPNRAAGTRARTPFYVRSKPPETPSTDTGLTSPSQGKCRQT
jgi:hypothetical protein